MRSWQIPFAALLLVAGPASAADSTYRDARQPSFTLLVPDGWTATRTDEGVTVASGQNSFHLNVQVGAVSPGAVLVMLRPQFEKQYKEFQERGAGNAAFGGGNGAYAVYAGIPPAGGHRVLRIVTMTNGRLTYTAFESCLEAESQATQPVLGRIERSFTPDPVQ